MARTIILELIFLYVLKFLVICCFGFLNELSIGLGWENLLNINFISPPEGICLKLLHTVEVRMSFEYDESVESFIQEGDFTVCATLNGGGASCVELRSEERLVLADLPTGCYRLMAWWEDHAKGTTGMSNAVQFEVADEEGLCYLGGCTSASLACSEGSCSAYHVGMSSEPKEWKQEATPKIWIFSPVEGEVLGEAEILFGAEVSDPRLVSEHGHLVCYKVQGGTGPEHAGCVDHLNPVSALNLPLGNYTVQAALAMPQDGVQFDVASSNPVKFSVTRDEFDAVSYRRREGFRHVYAGAHWTSAGGRSGIGSTIMGSRSDRAFILNTLLDTGTSSLFDAGCGSLHWQPLLFQDYKRLSAKEFRYHGSDIVPEIIAKHQAAYAEHVDQRLVASFSSTDITQDPLPAGFEVILCRHVLFHNTNDAVLKALDAFNTSGASYLLATTLIFKDRSQKESSVLGSIVNAETPFGTDGRLMDFGGYRPVCLEAEPFNLPPPVMFHLDNIEMPKSLEEFDQVLALWKLPFL